MAMSKKDYVQFAAMLKLENDYIESTAIIAPPPVSEYQARADAVRRYASKIAEIFANDNPRFDRTRFYKACGLIAE